MTTNPNCNNSKYGLKPQQLSVLFPFHFVFDAQLKLLQVGNVLSRLLPANWLDSHLEEHYEILRPDMEIDFKSICNQTSSTFVLKVIEYGIQLKGQMVYQESSKTVLFIGSPWITDIAQLKQSGLTLKDFPIHDSVSDYLFLIQGKNMVLSDSQEILAKLKQRGKELTAAKENLEEKVVERTASLAEANEEIIILNKKLKTENLRLGAELNVAQKLQQMVLPKPEEFDEIEGLDIVGFMEPADEVGGDYYDVLHADGVVTIGIGDVTGHGLESGILMLMTQTAVRTLQEVKERDPVRFLDTLNRTIFENVQRMDSEKNLTLAILNYSEGKVSISGQHEETIVVRKGGQLELIDTMDLGLPIGMDDDIADFIDHATVELHSGDGIVLYTDGIPEAFNLEKKQYGMERFCEVISKNWQLTAGEIKQAAIEDLRQFIGEQRVFDDITLLIFKQQ